MPSRGFGQHIADRSLTDRNRAGFHSKRKKHLIHRCYSFVLKQTRALQPILVRMMFIIKLTATNLIKSVAVSCYIV